MTQDGAVEEAASVAATAAPGRDSVFEEGEIT